MLLHARILALRAILKLDFNFEDSVSDTPLCTFDTFACCVVRTYVRAVIFAPKVMLFLNFCFSCSHPHYIPKHFDMMGTSVMDVF